MPKRLAYTAKIMEFVLAVFTLTGFSFTFWAMVGSARFLVEKIFPKPRGIGSLRIVLCADTPILERDVMISVNRRPQSDWGQNASKDYALERRSLFRRRAHDAPSTGETAILSIKFQRSPVKIIRVEEVPYPHAIAPSEVAAMVPAHNEERSIAATLRALKEILPAGHIYVGSDGSTDKTADIVRQEGCNVTEISPNRGKAGTLVYLLRRFQLPERYKAIMIIDADAEVDGHYLDYALPFFDDSKVAAVAGYGVTQLQGMRWWPPSSAMLFLAYRVRLWRVVQYAMRYGQTWRHINMTYIIPGSPSIYRSSVLAKL